MQYTSLRRIQCHFDTVMFFPLILACVPLLCCLSNVLPPLDCELSRAGTKDGGFAPGE